MRNTLLRKGSHRVPDSFMSVSQMIWIVQQQEVEMGTVEPFERSLCCHSKVGSELLW